MQLQYLVLTCLLCFANGKVLSHVNDVIAKGKIQNEISQKALVIPPEPAVRDDSNGGKAAKLRLGCYPDLMLPYHLWTATSQSTASECVRACRQQHFKFAALKNGVDCYCGSEEVRGNFYEDEDDLSKKADCAPCPGDPDEECGGPTSISLYLVPEDRRYYGCYNDVAGDRELTLQWSRDGRSARQCIDTCTVLGNRFAGAQEGGACYCGNSFGRHGEQDEELCNMTCHGNIRQNCGGELCNGIYMTERALDFSIPDKDPLIVSLFDGSGQMSQVSFSYFAELEKLRSVVTSKFVLTASDVISDPARTRCLTNCYGACGDIYHPDGFDNKGETLILRIFHLNLKDLPNYVAQDTKRLFVYAQTVVIEESLNVNYALLIRAREVVMSRSQAGSITVTVSDEAPVLDREDITKDAQPEMMFLKQSVMCSRILLDTKNQDDYNAALAIVDDVAYSKSDDPEISAFINQVKSVISEFVGMMRADIHYVPIYTKSRVSEILDIFGEEITIYKEEFDRVIGRELANRDYLNAVETMNQIFVETDVEEAWASYDSAMVSVQRGNGTYRSMYESFINATVNFETAKDTFESNLEQAIMTERMKGALRGFFRFITSGVKGLIDSVKDTIGAVKELKAVGFAVEELSNTLYEVSRITKSISEMDDIVDDLIERLSDLETEDDVMQFNDNIEAVVALAINIIEWTNFMDNCDVVMIDETVQGVNGAKGLHMAMLTVGHWGRGTSDAALEFAEALRVATEKRVVLEAKIEQQRRMEELMDELRGNPAEREAMTYAMLEQTYEVRLDLNEALVVFCQAYFFENLYECKDSYKPSFGGSLKDLLLKINAARRYALLIGDAPSSVQRTVRIEDAIDDEDCEDMILCPVRYFREHRMMYYTIPFDHDDLWDLDKYRVAEVELHFDGLASTSSNTILKLSIQTTGDSRGRSRDNIFHFLSRGLSNVYEFDIEDGRVSMKADVYAPWRDNVAHTTPFTTWVIRVSEGRSSDIDVSNVSNVRMVLRGSAVNIGG